MIHQEIIFGTDTPRCTASHAVPGARTAGSALPRARGAREGRLHPGPLQHGARAALSPARRCCGSDDVHVDQHAFITVCASRGYFY